MFTLILAADLTELTAIHTAIGGPTPVDLRERFREANRELTKQDLLDLLTAKQLDGNFYVEIGDAKGPAAIGAKIRDLGFPEVLVFVPREIWLVSSSGHAVNVRQGFDADRRSYPLSSTDQTFPIQASTDPQ